MNWDLSKEILEHPEYFENVVLIQNSFEEDKPDIIIDERGRMEEFFLRLPALKMRYEKSGFIYLLKPKNKSE